MKTTILEFQRRCLTFRRRRYSLGKAKCIITSMKMDKWSISTKKHPVFYLVHSCIFNLMSAVTANQWRNRFSSTACAQGHFEVIYTPLSWDSWWVYPHLESSPRPVLCYMLLVTTVSYCDYAQFVWCYLTCGESKLSKPRSRKVFTAASIPRIIPFNDCVDIKTLLPEPSRRPICWIQLSRYMEVHERCSHDSSAEFNDNEDCTYREVMTCDHKQCVDDEICIWFGVVTYLTQLSA